ncbi:helicase HerA-like domain-containing protein [Arsenophonus endosymbiont of Aleurodicus floccissimus]|uniref:helicase HerA-like domain-containing protein n=1 Tax=Arsenophonus endosymbiont of Aleurodicus floccissimus TaxID=2152761 RepID=UPI003F6F3F47
MQKSLVIAKNSETELAILPALVNRHGLITGATETGKTVTLQKMAESFSQIGVLVFIADVKGDLSGIGAKGVLIPKLQSRLEALGVTNWHPAACPVTFWDVFAELGHPSVPATISDIGTIAIITVNEFK